jgi:hypothetical protein
LVQICAVGFDQKDKEAVRDGLGSLGHELDFVNDVAGIHDGNVVLIPSYLDLSDVVAFDTVLDYVLDGGGLAVFYVMKSFTSMSVPINRLLLNFSMAYTLFILEEEGRPSSPIPVPENYVQVRDVNLVPLLGRFKAFVKQPSVDGQALDDLVTALRCYVKVCDESRVEELEQLIEYSWDFLKRNGYRTPKGICPGIAHSTVALLLFELTNRLPPAKVQAFPEHASFPGDLSAPMTSSAVQLTFQLEIGVWQSTGLWLSAGTIGVIECSESQPDVFVQIGAHTENIAIKQGPWFRWPLVATVRELDSPITEVATSFGGIVYLWVSPFAQATPPRLSLKFEGFVPHPTADARDPDVWERTKESTVPWGEIIAGGGIFTLPTKELAKLNVKMIDRTFTQIVEEIRKFLHAKTARTFRIVFDVELAGNGPVKYPHVFQVEDIPAILNRFDAPGAELFKAVRMMANEAIQEDCLDEFTEEAVSAVAAAVVFQKLFPAFDPTDSADLETPMLFHPLWQIQLKMPDVLPEVMAKLQEQAVDEPRSPEALWAEFVTVLCVTGGRNFFHLLDVARPTNFSLPSNVRTLPVFTPA